MIVLCFEVLFHAPTRIINPIQQSLLLGWHYKLITPPRDYVYWCPNLAAGLPWRGEINIMWFFFTTGIRNLRRRDLRRPIVPGIYPPPKSPNGNYVDLQLVHSSCAFLQFYKFAWLTFHNLLPFCLLRFKRVLQARAKLDQQKKKTCDSDVLIADRSPYSAVFYSQNGAFVPQLEYIIWSSAYWTSSEVSL